MHLPHKAGSSRILHLPSPRSFIAHAVPTLVESTLGPAAVFYVVLLAAGFRGALVAALAWSYAAAGRRLVRRQKLPGMLVLGLVLLTLRSAVSFATGSAFVYFVQPAAGTFVVGLLFLGSAFVRRPIIERLAHDFCPLDPNLMKGPHVQRFFLRISLLWAFVLFTNVGFVMWLLVSTSLKAFVVERTIVSAVLTVGGIVLSTAWFIRTMRREGITVRWGTPMPALVPSASAPPQS